MFIAGRRIFPLAPSGAKCVADAAPYGAKNDLTASIYKHFAPLALVAKHGFLPLNFSWMGWEPVLPFLLFQGVAMRHKRLLSDFGCGKPFSPDKA
jgi:hypothetical protein